MHLHYATLPILKPIWLKSLRIAAVCCKARSTLANDPEPGRNQISHLHRLLLSA